MRIGMGINLNQPQRIGPDGSTCSQAIPLNVTSGQTINGTITATGETWYRITNGVLTRAAYSNAVELEGYIGTSCGGLTGEGSNGVGPGSFQVDPDGFFRVFGSAGAAYTLTFTI